MPHHLILKGLNKMYTNYNMNQLTLDLSTSFSPRENHVAVFINEPLYISITQLISYSFLFKFYFIYN